MLVIDYKLLIEQFLRSEIPVERFIDDFLVAYKAEAVGLKKELFVVLEDLFEDIDAYSPRWATGDESPFRITLDSLRKEAEIALKKIKELPQTD
jgi:hypothetical protein